MKLGFMSFDTSWINKKIRIEHVLLFLMISTFIISFPWIPFFNYVKYFTLASICIYIIFNFKYLFKENKFIPINICVLILVILSLSFSYINIGTVERNSFLADIIDKGAIVAILLSFEIFYYKGLLSFTFIFFKKYIILISLFTGLLVLIFGDLVYIDGNYLVGNKFTLSYLILLAFCLYICDKNRIKTKFDVVKLILFCIIAFAVPIRVSCATGIVASLLALVLLIFLKNIKNKSIFIVIFVVFSILSVWFVFQYEDILSLPIVKTIIEDFLNRDLTLTTRTRIYSEVPGIIFNEIWLGYGFGSSYQLLTDLIGAPNAQNGILNLILEEGIFVFVIYYLAIIYCLTKIDSKYNGLKIYILVMMFISSVEITFNSSLLIYSIIGMILSSCQNTLLISNNPLIEQTLVIEKKASYNTCLC